MISLHRLCAVFPVMALLISSSAVGVGGLVSAPIPGQSVFFKGISMKIGNTAGTTMEDPVDIDKVSGNLYVDTTADAGGADVDTCPLEVKCDKDLDWPSAYANAWDPDTYLDCPENGNCINTSSEACATSDIQYDDSGAVKKFIWTPSLYVGDGCEGSATARAYNSVLFDATSTNPSHDNRKVAVAVKVRITGGACLPYSGTMPLSVKAGLADTTISVATTCDPTGSTAVNRPESTFTYTDDSNPRCHDYGYESSSWTPIGVVCVNGDSFRIGFEMRIAAGDLSETVDDISDCDICDTDPGCQYVTPITVELLIAYQPLSSDCS